MNHSDLIKAVANETGETLASSTRMVNALIKVTSDALAKGDEVTFHAMGKFSVANRAERTARNPQTGVKVIVPARKAVKFSVAKALKELVA